MPFCRPPSEAGSRGSAGVSGSARTSLRAARHSTGAPPPRRAEGATRRSCCAGGCCWAAVRSTTHR
eukprot:589668-Prymnesium_polylepis.1